MKTQFGKSSWVAFALFYVVLLIIISILDWVYGVLTPKYWGAQTGLITLGVGILAIIGARMPTLPATQSVLLAFTIGILTIIPAVLMGLGRIPNFWPQYFSIAFGMAAGSFLTFLFLKLSERLTPKEETELERDYFE